MTICSFSSSQLTSLPSPNFPRFSLSPADFPGIFSISRAFSQWEFSLCPADFPGIFSIFRAIFHWEILTMFGGFPRDFLYLPGFFSISMRILTMSGGFSRYFRYLPSFFSISMRILAMSGGFFQIFSIFRALSHYIRRIFPDFFYLSSSFSLYPADFPGFFLSSELFLTYFIVLWEISTMFGDFSWYYLYFPSSFSLSSSFCEEFPLSSATFPGISSIFRALSHHTHHSMRNSHYVRRIFPDFHYLSESLLVQSLSSSPLNSLSFCRIFSISQDYNPHLKSSLTSSPLISLFSAIFSLSPRNIIIT